jgi:hypothetical protein
MKWCYKKYGNKSYATMINNLFYNSGNNKGLKSMTIGSSDSHATLKVKSLRDLSVPGLFFMHKPDNKLKVMSMLINPEPYIKRALRLAAEKKNIRSQIIISQNLKCAICHKPLLDFNKLSNLSNFGQKVTCINSIYDNGIFNTEITKSLAIKYIGET